VESEVENDWVTGGGGERRHLNNWVEVVKETFECLVVEVMKETF
jgi:hypothetical protein